MNRPFQRYAPQPAVLEPAGPSTSPPTVARPVAHQALPPRAGAAEDRRGDIRVVTVCRLVKVATGRRESLARCRNISNGGVKLEMHMPAKVDEPVTIAFSPAVEIDGRIVWIEGCDIGVSFDIPIDCISVLRETALSNPGARAPRLKTALPASLLYEGGQCGSLVSDISLQGMCVSHDGALVTGRNVRVMMADGRERRAMVCWTRGGRAGLQLLDRFRLEELSPLLVADGAAASYY